MVVKVTVVQNPGNKAVISALKLRQARMVGAGLINVHRRASVLLDQWVQRNFKSEGRGLTDPWPPFKLGGRPIKGGGIDASAKLLQDTGTLRISHLPFYSKKDAGIGSDIPYAKYHEEGIGVPMRRTLPKSEEVRASLTRLFNAHVKEALK